MLDKWMYRNANYVYVPAEDSLKVEGLSAGLEHPVVYHRAHETLGRRDAGTVVELKINHGHGRGVQPLIGIAAAGPYGLGTPEHVLPDLSKARRPCRTSQRSLWPEPTAPPSKRLGPTASLSSWTQPS